MQKSQVLSDPTNGAATRSPPAKPPRRWNCSSRTRSGLAGDVVA